MVNSCLVNPVLAFVMSYRIKGNSANLSSKLSAKCIAADIDDALKKLWPFCHDDLSGLGFTYHTRRSSDPLQLFNTVLGDLIVALDNLDVDNSLPPIYCEASDLLTLPSLDLDPVAKLVESNSIAVTRLAVTIEEMKSENERITFSLDSLDQFVKSANTLEYELTAAVHVLCTGFGQSTSGNSIGSITKALPNSKVVSPEC